MVVSGGCQSTFYVEHGGQPGHRSAWMNKKANELTNNFFTNVLPAMNRGYIRPRYNGYLHFQDKASNPLKDYLMQGGNPKEVLMEMNDLYQESIVRTKSSLLL